MGLSGPPQYRAFFEELSRLGYVEGQNLVIDRYSGEGRPERYSELVRDVINTHPDLILAVAARLSLDFKMATTTIPIVTIVNDPVALGLVASIARRAATSQALPSRRNWNSLETYRAAGRGAAGTVHPRLPCVAVVLGRLERLRQRARQPNEPVFR
ncbi:MULTISPECIES: ABC transporter substrate binding protein [unclassified Bradyrhizobium]|jgi:hypothetical protein|uniref:ABC transporter substrate binding protein n=1 Tax=unclassified Bradyrhizobium TaxID=2631580 RepID=UPI001FFA1071|nr:MULTISPECIES: ABC transporter substrate binding protein [unclassified Bradyrhizobium]MCK1292415.1 hypothetical protein [Bradyrhizobium sp. 30]MCK1305047.1 hypothetical protein [Bradyrhizobium sp. 45]MCK1329771.1 hypothetical protein [Bradyrhizobium sp. CW9]MCK1607482.1 hypothetical protein [Bradyrhizobium sp. 163]MCK1629125.1 hypothetical protein [Bradyrhizobium sp. 162]